MQVWIFLRVFFLVRVHLCVSKQWLSDPRPSTCYLYLLSALFSFCWAMGTELWNQWAAACTNGLGSAVRLFNPFQHSLTLMSPGSCRPRRIQDWQTHTHTHTPLNTTSPLRACLMMLFCCNRLTPDPVTSVLSCLPPSLPYLSPISLHRSQRGHRWLWAWKTRKRTPWGEVRHLQTHPFPLTLTLSPTHARINTHTHSIIFRRTCLLRHGNTICSCKQARTHQTTLQKSKHNRHLMNHITLFFRP